MVVDTDLPFDDLEPWDLDEPEIEEPGPPSWRKPVIVVVAVVTALALALVPVYAWLTGPVIADNGLEVCGFDYCLVQDRVREAGLDGAMSRLANTFLSDGEAAALAAELAEFLGVEPVALGVVDELSGRLGGVYDAASRSILIERPARAWTVLHEMAHTVASGHDDTFVSVLVEMARWAETRVP